MMNQSQAMMVPGVMDAMGNMQGMVGPMGMGMNDMSGMNQGMNQGMGGGMGMMNPGMDAMQGGQGVGMMQAVDGQQGMQDGGFGNPNAAGMMNMGMGEYAMQVSLSFHIVSTRRAND